MVKVYEDAKDTAKKIRKALKENFKGVKFSVKSNTYSMGSSVYVNWVAGPSVKEVDDIVNHFKSSSFNSMEDMKETKGYIYEGVLYVGADYILTSRDRG